MREERLRGHETDLASEDSSVGTAEGSRELGQHTSHHHGQRGRESLWCYQVMTETHRGDRCGDHQGRCVVQVGHRTQRRALGLSKCSAIISGFNSTPF